MDEWQPSTRKQTAFSDAAETAMSDGIFKQQMQTRAANWNAIRRSHTDI